MGTREDPVIRRPVKFNNMADDMEMEGAPDVTTVAEPVETEPLDTVSALKQVLKKALCHDGLARGIRECAKMLDKRRVHLCVLPTTAASQHTRSSSRLCALSMGSTSCVWRTTPSLVNGLVSARLMLRAMLARLFRAPASASPTTVSSPKHSTTS